MHKDESSPKVWTWAKKVNKDRKNFVNRSNRQNVKSNLRKIEADYPSDEGEVKEDKIIHNSPIVDFQTPR